MSIISKVEVIDFTYELENMGAASENSHNHVGYQKGGVLPMTKYAVVIECEDGSRGEYVTPVSYTHLDVYKRQTERTTFFNSLVTNRALDAPLCDGLSLRTIKGK